MKELIAWLNETLPAEGPVEYRLVGVLSLGLIILYCVVKAWRYTSAPTPTQEEIESKLSTVGRLMLMKMRRPYSKLIMLRDQKLKTDSIITASYTAELGVDFVDEDGKRIVIMRQGNLARGRTWFILTNDNWFTLPQVETTYMNSAYDAFIYKVKNTETYAERVLAEKAIQALLEKDKKKDGTST